MLENHWTVLILCLAIFFLASIASFVIRGKQNRRALLRSATAQKSPVFATSANPAPASCVLQIPAHQASAPMPIGREKNIGFNEMHINPPSYDTAMNMPQPAIAPYNPDFDGHRKF